MIDGLDAGLASLYRNGGCQGRREGVKGVTVSRGPGLKRGPENNENLRKTGYSREILSLWTPNLQASRALKSSDHRLSYSAYTNSNQQVGRGPVKIGFTGPGRALDAPECLRKDLRKEKIFLNSLHSPGHIISFTR